MDSIYERALCEVGHKGKFQKSFDVIYNFIFICLWSVTFNSILLALVIIPHWCKLPQKTENISDVCWKEKYIPMSENNTGNLVYNSCEIYIDPDESNDTRACDVFVYNTTWYGNTITSVNNWICDKELYAANIIAYSKIGEAVGSIIFGWFGDQYGRRVSYIISLGLLILGRTISIVFYQSYIIFIIGSIIAWFPSWTAVQSATVISMEISAPDRRSKIATLRTIGCSTGMCLMPLLYWWLRDWQTFMIVSTLTLAPFVVFSRKMIESPRWLLIEGRGKSCLKELNRIANTNKNKILNETQKKILTIKPAKKTQTLGPVSLFSSWILAKNTILQLYLWVSVSLSYMVLLMSLSETSDRNPFLEVTWTSLVELPATFVGAWLADNLGRRYAGALSYFVSSIMWVLIVIREIGTFTWMQEWWIGSTLFIINRLATTISYYVIYLFNMELYPTSLRQSGMSLGNVLSSGGSAIAPYLMYIGRRDKRLQGSILSLVTIMGMISSLLLPETLNSKLPETVQDAWKGERRNESHYEAVPLKTDLESVK